MLNKLYIFLILFLIYHQNQQEYDLKNLLDQKNFHYLPLKKCIQKECKKNQKLLNEMSCIQNCLKKITKENSDKKKSFLKEVQQLPKDFCLNSKPRENLSKKQMLTEFAKGPCNPIILAPGVMSTKLVVKVKCQELREQEPNTFSLCGWNACEKTISQFWRTVPKEEYVLWIPSVTGPLSIFSISVSSNLCFANLIKPHFDLSKPPGQIIVPRKGVEIKIYGFTEGTKKDKDCGGSAIRDLLPLPLQNETTTAFGNFLNSFEHIGYVSGLTIQPIPYNFYYSYRNNEFKKGFKQNLVKLNKHTGKRVTLIAHSMGNINILYNLNLLTLKEKVKYVYNYISIAPPFLGSAKVIKILLSGNDEFTTLGGYLGFHYPASVKTCSNQLSIYDLLVKNPFSVYKDEEFMNEYIYKRIHYEENDDVPFEESGIPFWPKKEDICHDDSLVGIKKNCNIGFYNFNGEKNISFENLPDKYSYDEMQSMFEKYSITKNTAKLFEKLYKSDVVHYKPGVPTFLIFNNSVNTSFKMRFNKDYKDKIAAGKFPTPPLEIMINGDKTVPTFSAITTPLKWAYEFQKDKSDPENHPVKFVEYCSSLDTYKNIYDYQDEFGKHISKNDYMGLKCVCMNRDLENFDDICDHASLVSDMNLIKFLHKVVNADQKVDENVFERIEKLDEEDLNRIVDVCDHIYSGMFYDRKVKVEEL